MHACTGMYYMHYMLQKDSPGHQPTASQLRIQFTSNSLPFSHLYISISPLILQGHAVHKLRSTMLSGSLLESGEGVHWYVPTARWN
jgi:hypothetical protein